MLALLLALALLPGPRLQSHSTLEVRLRLIERTKPFSEAALGHAEVELGIGALDPVGKDTQAWPVLTRARSDASGLVHVSLEVPPQWRDVAEPHVWARVVEPGYQRTARSFAPNASGDNLPELKTEAGGTLYGVVCDTRGEPVPGAWVGLIQGRMNPRVGPRTDSLGRFALHWPVHLGGERVTVQARKEGRGIAESAPLGLAGDIHLSRIVLSLTPGVALEGRVTDPERRPVAGLVVTAVTEEGFPRGGRLFAGEDASGLRVARGVTDTFGHFRIDALAPGGYTLRARHAGTGSDKLPRIGDPPGPELGTSVAPTTGPVELVYPGHRLEVRVRSGTGEPLDLAAALAGEEAGAPHLEVFELAGGFQAIEGRAAGDQAVFGVKPNREYLVTWSQPGVRLREERIVTHRAGGDPLHLVTLNLEAPAPPAEAILRVRDWAGRELDVAAAVDVVSAETGRHVASTKVTLFSSFTNYSNGNADRGWRLPLPPGRYRAKARHVEHQGCVLPPVYPRTVGFEATAEFELLPGDEQIVELRLGAAGHLDFVGPGLEPSPVDLELRQLDRDEVKRRLGAAAVFLVGPDGEPRQARGFSVPASGAWSFDHLDWIAPGYGARGLDPLPPGDWTLKVISGDEVLLERPVSIRAGEVTEVRW